MDESRISQITHELLSSVNGASYYYTQKLVSYLWNEFKSTSENSRQIFPTFQHLVLCRGTVFSPEASFIIYKPIKWDKHFDFVVSAQTVDCIYVEGYTLKSNGCEHSAWLWSRLTNRIFDPLGSGLAYMGVKFNQTFVLDMYKQNLGLGIFSDRDFLIQGFPNGAVYQ